MPGGKKKDWRRRTTLFVETSAEKFLIDCGPDIRKQLMGRQAVSDLDYEPIEHFDALLLTHSHTDHINGLDELSALQRSKKVDAIPTYATEATWEEVVKRFGYLIGRQGEGKLLVCHTAVPGKELVGL